MRALRSLAVLTALTVLPAAASAQYPGGGGYGGGRPAGSRTSPNGLPETSSLEPKTDAGPKSEELVDLKPILRGIKLQPTTNCGL